MRLRPLIGLRGLVLLLAVSAAVLSCGQRSLIARDGEIDLRAWNPGVDGPVRLEGEWRFVPGTLVPPEAPLPEHTVILRVPGYWSGAPTAEGGMGARGFGTYRLRVLLPPNAPSLGIRIETFASAARYFGNGSLLAEEGRVGRDARTSVPGYRPGVLSLPVLDGGVLEVTVQGSNFHLPRGGFQAALWLGTPAALTTSRSLDIVVESAVVGGLAMIGIYHLALFGLRRKEPFAFYFGVACLGMVLRGLAVDERVVLHLVPTLPWEWLIRMSLGSVFLVTGALLLYLQRLFPSETPRKPVQVLAGASGGFFLVLVATGILSWTPWALLWAAIWAAEILALAGILFATLPTLRIVRRRRPGWKVFAAGILVLAFVIVHDVGRAHGTAWWDVYLAPFGLFLFVVFHSFLIASRLSRTYVDLERSRGDLEATVGRLQREKLERERYQELSLAAAGVAHETKNPLGIIRGLAQRLSRNPGADSRIRGAASLILEEADRAVSRLGDFLSYARQREPRLGPVEIGALARQVLDLLGPDFEARDLEAVCAVPRALVEADEEMLIQILLNLVLNSLLASEDGGRIRLTFESSAGSGRIAVEDEGAGIDPELLPRVLRPYVSGRPGGHGLGLAIVDRLASLHGWALEIESSGDGTRVTLGGIRVIDPPDPAGPQSP